MSVYIDEWGNQNPQATITVNEDSTRSLKITYKGTKGGKFSVKVFQKPNPIGFHAKLPGGKRK